MLVFETVVAQFLHGGAVEVVEERLDLLHLPLFDFGKSVAESLGLMLDVLEGEGGIVFEG